MLKVCFNKKREKERGGGEERGIVGRFAKSSCLFVLPPFASVYIDLIIFLFTAQRPNSGCHATPTLTTLRSTSPPSPFGTKRIHYWTLKTFCSWLCFAFHHHVFILLSIMATFLIELPSCGCNLDPLAKCETCSCNSCKLVILWSVLPRPANVALFDN